MDEIEQKQRAMYLRELLQRYGTVSLPVGAGLSFSLAQVFQPLRLRVRANDGYEERSQGEEEEQVDGPEQLVEANNRTERHEDVQDLFAENGIEALAKSPGGRLVILGGPGTGKTTVLKYLLCHHARLALDDDRVPLPIFLALPDLARAGQDLENYCAQVASDSGLDLSAGTALFTWPCKRCGIQISWRRCPIFCWPCRIQHRW